MFLHPSPRLLGPTEKNMDDLNGKKRLLELIEATTDIDNKQLLAYPYHHPLCMVYHLSIIIEMDCIACTEGLAASGLIFASRPRMHNQGCTCITVKFSIGLSFLLYIGPCINFKSG